VADDVNELNLQPPFDFMQTVWAVDHALQNLSRAMEKKLGLSGPQRLVVRVIGQFPGISGIALARILHLDPSSLTWHVSHLVRRRIVARAVSSRDKRQIELRLTARGKRLDVATPGTVQAAVEELATYVEREDLDNARAVLSKLAGALQRQRGLLEKPSLAPTAASRRRPPRNSTITRPSRGTRRGAR
jgi:DNA-binding MarR family transcriptional regulator